MEIGRPMLRESGALSARSMVESLVVHAVLLALLMLLGASVLLRSGAPRSKKEIDIVFYRPAAIPVPATVPPPPTRGTNAAESKSKAAEAPKGPGQPELPPGPDKGFSAEAKPPEPNVGKAGILAFKDQFASLAQDKVAPRLGTDARYAAADDVGQVSSHSVLTSNTPGSSGGIDPGSLSRNVGGGGGRGGGGGGGGGMPGVKLARATSSIAPIGGGDRPKAHSGPGASRTDEEIQIVFDRYKSAFYRDYNRELRRNPTLQGKMVLRLTIEPDGSVSMCQLQSTDMDAPDLAAQVVNRVKTINFGAKDGVQAVTIVYPIDFLPAT
jgi:membrane protein involved in colicin uptake